jgi:uncharacterized protein (TIGR02246 family)
MMVARRSNREMRGEVIMRRMARWVVIGACVAGAGTATAAEQAADVRAAVAAAAKAYADAYNKRDYAALADQWTAGAQLVEGGARVAGRERIVASIRGWLDRHPQATLAVEVTDVELVAPTLARVRGRMRFARKPGEQPQESPYTSLRIDEAGRWRLAESVVAPNQAAALDDLSWLVGRWRAADAASGTAIDAVYEKAVGGRAILGRITLRPKEGKPVESLEVIHADRGTGAMHVAIHDSTGAHAEGVIESDGTSFNRSLVGVPGDGVAGSRAQWVQTIVPGGPGGFTMHSIERALDGRPLPDGQPMHFKRQ